MALRLQIDRKRPVVGALHRRAHHKPRKNSKVSTPRSRLIRAEPSTRQSQAKVSGTSGRAKGSPASSSCAPKPICGKLSPSARQLRLRVTSPRRKPGSARSTLPATRSSGVSVSGAEGALRDHPALDRFRQRKSRHGRRAEALRTHDRYAAPAGPVCHVALVDARENADHNALARRAADDIARGFRCDADQVKVIGKRGRAIELIGP